MRGEFVDLQGVRLYYYAAGTRGAGEPIVLLHGFPTSGRLWHDVVGQLPTGHRIIVVDLLGYGRSDPPRDRPLSLHAHAERVVRLLDELGVDDACIVGHHLGGGIAQALALDWPARVTRLGLIDSVALDGWPSRDVRIARHLARLLPGQWLNPILRADLERGYTDPARAQHSIDKYQRPFSDEAGQRALRQHLRALDRRETVAFGKRLHELRVPVSVLWGAHDPFLPTSLGRRLAGAIPGATFTAVNDARHFTPEDAPRAVADAIGALLRRS